MMLTPCHDCAADVWHNSLDRRPIRCSNCRGQRVADLCATGQILAAWDHYAAPITEEAA